MSESAEQSDSETPQEPGELPERVELSTVRDQINAVLKNQQQAYWDTLRKYLQLKLAKRELDELVFQMLGLEHSTHIGCGGG